MAKQLYCSEKLHHQVELVVNSPDHSLHQIYSQIHPRYSHCTLLNPIQPGFGHGHSHHTRSSIVGLFRATSAN